MMAAPSPLLVLQALAEARAFLYEIGDFDNLEQAIAPLMQYALEAGIDERICSAILKAAFEGEPDL